MMLAGTKMYGVEAGSQHPFRYGIRGSDALLVLEAQDEEALA